MDTLVLVFPVLLALGTAVAVHKPVQARAQPTPFRAVGASVVAQIAVAALALGIAIYEINQPVEVRCGRDRDLLEALALVLLFGVAVVGGVVLAAVVAAAKWLRGVEIWHGLVVLFALALPYVVGFGYLIWGISCTS